VAKLCLSCVIFIKTVLMFNLLFSGLDHQGIFRLSGSTTEINDMKQLFENGKYKLGSQERRR